MSGLQARYMSICGAFCITPDTAGVTDLNPANMPLRNANFTGTVTAGAFVTTGGGTPGPATFSQITVTQGTITALATGIQQTVTWNNAAVTFVAQDLNVTDTASNVASILAQWRVGGTVQFSIAKSGNITVTAGATIGAGSKYRWSTHSAMGSSADGLINLANNALTGFTRLTLGLETALFPSLKVNGAILQVRLGDDSDFTTVSASDVRLNKAASAPAAGVVDLGNAVQTTIGGAGGASALPLTPLGYLLAYIGAQQIAIPYYLPV